MGSLDDIQIFVYDSTRVFEIFKHRYAYVDGSILLGLVGTSLFSCTLHEMNKQHTDKYFLTTTVQFTDILRLH